MAGLQSIRIVYLDKIGQNGQKRWHSIVTKNNG